MASETGRFSARRVIAEFGIIVAGVLVALAVDEWRQSLRDQAAEVTYVDRLIEDVRADTAELSGALSRGEEKEGRLRRLIDLSEQDLTRVDDLSIVSEDLDRSQGWGWEYPTARTITFDELLSVGALDLIRDADVRREINDYYWWHEDTEDRVEARQSGFPALAYELLVQANPGGESTTVSAETLVQSIRSGELHRAARAELNFTRYQMSATHELIAVAAALIELLEDYQRRLNE